MYYRNLIPDSKKCLYYLIAFCSIMELAPISAQELINNGRLRVKGNTSPSSGTGVEIGYSSGANQGIITAYDRNNSDYKRLRLNSSELKLQINGSTKFIIAVDGNVGIGTITPERGLHLQDGRFLISHSSQSPSIFFRDDADNDEFAWSFNRGGNRLDLEINGVDTHSFLKNGNVGIGTNTVPLGYKLAVAGKIITEEIKVELNTNWPDYVFADNYQLGSLAELESYIKENKHLPGIPSQNEVEKEGILLGEMQGKFLEKIEELTLYVIEIKKENDQLKNRVDELEKTTNPNN